MRCLKFQLQNLMEWNSSDTIISKCYHAVASTSNYRWTNLAPQFPNIYAALNVCDIRKEIDQIKLSLVDKSGWKVVNPNLSLNSLRNVSGIQSIGSSETSVLTKIKQCWESTHKDEISEPCIFSTQRVRCSGLGWTPIVLQWHNYNLVN